MYYGWPIPQVLIPEADEEVAANLEDRSGTPLAVWDTQVQMQKPTPHSATAEMEELLECDIKERGEPSDQGDAE